MRCYRCGTRVEPGDQFCRLCGVEFLPAPTPATRRFDAGRPRSIISMFGVGLTVAALLWVVYRAVQPFAGRDRADQVAIDLGTLPPVSTSVVVGLPGEVPTTAPATTTPPTTTARTVPLAPPGPLEVSEVEASCTGRNSTDSRGNRVSFSAENLIDGDNASGWRCPGRGRGVTVTFTFSKARSITGIASIPGYDRIDPFNGEDRFKQNRRVARIRWSCLSKAGTTIAEGEQAFEDDRTSQSFAPKGFSKCVSLRGEILEATRSGGRDNVAMSEVAIAGR